jgi:hypothetical protein
MPLETLPNRILFQMYLEVVEFALIFVPFIHMM